MNQVIYPILLIIKKQAPDILAVKRNQPDRISHAVSKSGAASIRK